MKVRCKVWTRGCMDGDLATKGAGTSSGVKCRSWIILFQMTLNNASAVEPGSPKNIWTLPTPAESIHLTL